MELKTYLMAMPVFDREAFAKRCDTSLGHLHNVMRGYKPCATDLAVAIERESGGEVRRAELRPLDYWRHWPDLPAPQRIIEGQAA